MEVRHERQSSGRVIAALAALVFVVVALVTVVKDNSQTAPPVDPQSCLAVEDGWERLACYDRAMHRHPQDPARGANVPMK